ncbi:MAG: hypothetical protein ONB31_13155 [candidate division KSB1 bacterium]|nr:hypothetical protein [candidate division KSB1 bacterium]MDZ7335732.1 hypothetical protein [candidate division KSB1 bacterium]MDZ7357915.1 hypothetical protein [candidate division KSB1 bacterium]MDZ7401617.1 hypothetical protein [candidate division KSB1 bacterium]
MKAHIIFLVMILMVKASPVSSSQRSGSPKDTIVVSQKQIYNYRHELGRAILLIVQTKSDSVIQGKFEKLAYSLLILKDQDVYKAQALSDIKKITAITKRNLNTKGPLIGMIIGFVAGFAIAAIAQEEEPSPPPDYGANEPNLSSQERMERSNQQAIAQSQYQREVESVRLRNQSFLIFFPLLGAGIGSLIGKAVDDEKGQSISTTVYIFADNMNDIERQQLGLVNYQGQ